jgi:hypothetical protein
MAGKLTKWPQNKSKSSISIPSKIYPNWDFGFENISIWQPWFGSVIFSPKIGKICMYIAENGD